MEKFSGWLESINAFSSKIAWRSPTNCPMVLPVLLRRQANGFVLAEVAPFVETAAKMFGAVDAERTVVTAGAATFGSVDGLVRVFAVWRQRSHAPARHSRHNKIQMNGRERITIGQMIISQNHHNARIENGALR
jgi:hypothetical protein